MRGPHAPCFRSPRRQRFLEWRAVRFLTSILLTPFVYSSALHAGVNEWTTHGPAGLTAFAIAPSPPETLYASSGDGIFRSIDHGETWNLLSRVFTGIQPPPTFITVDAMDPSKLYVSAN